MRKALDFIISKIVEDPSKVEIREETSEDGIINFIIKVPKEEMGKVIGKEGKVIRAIRNVVKIPAIREGKKINISLEEITSE